MVSRLYNRVKITTVFQAVDGPRQSVPVHAVWIPVWRWAIHVPAQCRPVRRQHLSVLRRRDHVGAWLPTLAVDRIPRSQARESLARQGRPSQADRLRICKEAWRQVYLKSCHASKSPWGVEVYAWFWIGHPHWLTGRWHKWTTFMHSFYFVPSFCCCTAVFKLIQGADFLATDASFLYFFLFFVFGILTSTGLHCRVVTVKSTGTVRSLLNKL